MADRVRGLSAHVSASVFATSVALVCATAPHSVAASNNLFIQAKGGAPAPSGAQGLCSTYSWACASGGAAARGNELQTVMAINSQVNHSVRRVEDTDQYGVDEYWALPTRTGGDCEDFALLKKRELVSHGVDPRRLLIATVLDRQRQPHAVLIYRSEQGDLVLDNLTDRVRGWRDTRYMFLQMQDPNRPSRWVNVLTSG